MSNKVILVVSDGLRDDTAAQQMGYLEHLVEQRLATRYTVKAEMPTVSRVLYETLHTGTPPAVHGITSNIVARLSKMPNIFGLAKDKGLVTAATAYYWYSELYNRYPYEPVDDCEVNDAVLPIQHGRFYFGGSTPDVDLVAMAAHLVRQYAPDYLLVHPMGMDHVGETYGADTAEYRNHAQQQETIFGRVLPEWLERGYTILFTADHGLNRDRSHGGSTPDVRNVPLYYIRPDGNGAGNTGTTVSQLRIAPTICQLLSLSIPETMKAPPLSPEPEGDGLAD